MNDDRAASHFHVLHMLDMYQAAAVAVAAVRSGILDLLVDAPLSIEDITETLNYDPGVTHRFVRNLVALNYLKMNDDLVELDETGKALTGATPFRLREKALLIGTEYAAGWFGLHAALSNGAKSAYEGLCGESVWEHRKQDEEIGSAFTRLMQMNAPRVLKVLESFPFEDYETVVDFGGGDGTILQGLMDRYPRMRGILVDQSHVVQHLASTERLTVQGADIFSDDLVLRDMLNAGLGVMCHVIHDWPTPDAVKLLRGVARSLGDKPRILVVERIASDPALPLDAMRDLHMMAITGGQERTRPEFEELFEMAGLEICKEGESWMLLRKRSEAT